MEKSKYHSLTVTELRAKCKKLGGNPGTLKKDQLLQLYEGLREMRKRGQPVLTGEELLDPERDATKEYTAVWTDTDRSWRTHLREEGWTVIDVRRYCPDFDVSYYEEALFQYLESFCPDFDRENSDTWKGTNVPYNLHGIMKHDIGHTEDLWKAREELYPLWRKVLREDDLLCSFDGACFLTKGKYKQWVHSDSSRTDHCYQGLLNLRYCGKRDGGLLLLERSHLIYEKYLRRNPIDCIGGFQRANMNDKYLKHCRAIKVCANAGEFVIWDGRVFHCNVCPKDEGRLRMCLYISMQEKSKATRKELQKRVGWYEKGLMTGHWCYGDFLCTTGKNPGREYTKNYPRPEEPEIAELNPLRRKLIGYDSDDSESS